MLGNSYQSIFDYCNLQDGMWKCTLSDIHILDANVWDYQINTLVKMYLLAALLYRVSSWQLFKRSNHVLYGREFNANNNTKYTVIFVTNYYYQENDPEWESDSGSVISRYTTTIFWQQQILFGIDTESSHSNQHSLQSHMRLGTSGGTTVK